MCPFSRGKIQKSKVIGIERIYEQNSKSLTSKENYLSSFSRPSGILPFILFEQLFFNLPTQLTTNTRCSIDRAGGVRRVHTLTRRSSAIGVGASLVAAMHEVRESVGQPYAHVCSERSRRTRSVTAGIPFRNGGRGVNLEYLAAGRTPRSRRENLFLEKRCSTARITPPSSMHVSTVVPLLTTLFSRLSRQGTKTLLSSCIEKRMLCIQVGSDISTIVLGFF